MLNCSLYSPHELLLAFLAGGISCSLLALLMAAAAGVFRKARHMRWARRHGWTS
jgi:hypothetical protein